MVAPNPSYGLTLIYKVLKMKINRRSLGLLMVLGGLLIAVPVYTYNRKISIENVTKTLSVEQVYQQAQAITVKVLSSSDSLGSGILVKNQGDVYQVLTNDHVLTGTKPPYQIQTYDRVIHPAEVVQGVDFHKQDLALLQFKDKGGKYAIAKVGQSVTLSQGEALFAGGFPYIPPLSKGGLGGDQTTGFTFTQGKFVLKLDKALEGGYQVGYTNRIEKGMSGGPLLNAQGKLVAVNGMHAYPLWDAPDYYEDGSQPSPDLEKIIIESSWGIPIEKTGL